MNHDHMIYPKCGPGWFYDVF